MHIEMCIKVDFGYTGPMIDPETDRTRRALANSDPLTFLDYSQSYGEVQGSLYIGKDLPDH